jgi:hypothetical protein
MACHYFDNYICCFKKEKRKMNLYKGGFFMTLFLLMNEKLLDGDLFNIVGCGVFGLLMLVAEKHRG